MKFSNKKIIAISLSASIFLSFPFLSSAQNRKLSQDVKTTQNQTQLLTRMKDRANQEIDRRIMHFNEVSLRFQSLYKLSDSDRSSIEKMLQTQISDLNSLKVKISSETDIKAVRGDVESVVKSYQVFAILVPEARIMAAADRIKKISDMLTVVSQKLQARMSDIKAGIDVSDIQILLTDMNAKIADAQKRATDAVTEVSSLTPNLGDKTKFTEEKSTLKDARTKIVVAHKDLSSTRKDAGKILAELQSMSKESATSTPSSTSTQSK